MYVVHQQIVVVWVSITDKAIHQGLSNQMEKTRKLNVKFDFLCMILTHKI